MTARNWTGPFIARTTNISVLWSYSLELADFLGYHDGKTHNLSLGPYLFPRELSLTCLVLLTFPLVIQDLQKTKKTAGGQKELQYRAKVNRGQRTGVHIPVFCLLLSQETVILLIYKS